MIKSIRLLNWRSHADTTLRFSQGANLLVGRMGAGKSSVMDAISFALFGTFPALERRKLRTQDLFRLSGDRASVALEFRLDGQDGHDYLVERTLTRGKSRTDSDAKLFRDSALLESGSVAVTGLVSSLLSVDYDLFTRAIYSEQNNIDHFLSLDPRRRKEELDALLGLDRFEAARANSVSVINRIKSQRKLLDDTFGREKLDAATKEHAAQKEQLESLRSRLVSVTAQESRAKTAQQETEKAFASIAAKKDSSERLSKEKTGLDAVLGQLKSELHGKQAEPDAYEKAKNALEAKRKEADSSRAEMKKLDAELSELLRRSGSAKARVERRSTASKELDFKKHELVQVLAGDSTGGLETSLRAAENEALSLASEQRSLVSSIKELEELVRGLKPGASDCPVCGGPLGEKGMEHVIAEKKARISEMSLRSSGLDRPVAEKRRLASDISLRLKKAGILQESIARMEKELSDTSAAGQELMLLTEKVTSCQQAKQALDTRLSSLNAEAQSLALESSRMAELVAKRKKLEDSEKRLSAVSEQLSALGFDQGQYDAFRKSAEDARMALSSASGERKSLDAQLKLASAAEERLGKEVAQIGQARKDAERCAMLEEQLNIYSQALKDTQVSLRTELAAAINSAMAEVWPIFYPYGNYPSIRLSATDKDYLIEVSDRGAWKPLESVASGGERACAALTIRVALAAVLTPNLSWLVLDEPTHNLDSEAVALLSDTLQSKVPEVVKQTFVITHEEGLMGADFASAYRLSRDGNGSGPTRAEKI